MHDAFSKIKFRCLVLRIGHRTWHWHWPRARILACSRSALAARDRAQDDKEGPSCAG